MNRLELHKVNLTNICIILSFLSLAPAAVTALGGTGGKTPELFDKAAVAHARMIAAENRRALEAYEKRNADITPWVEDAVSANTDNAALLYYQACLFVPEPNEAIRFEIRPNAGPTTQIRTYLGHCLSVIEMLETASRIPECSWWVWHKGGLSRMPWTREIGFVTDILLLDATTLAVDGHYRVALERCLTVRRIARHISDDPEWFSFGTSLDGQAMYTIRILLGMMPPDVDILTWFRGQFAVVPGPRLSYATTWRRVVKLQLDAMRTDPDRLRFIKNVVVTETQGEQTKESIRNLTDEQFLSRARGGLARFSDSIFRILDSEANCNQKLAQMNGFVDEMM